MRQTLAAVADSLTSQKVLHHQPTYLGAISAPIRPLQGQLIRRKLRLASVRILRRQQVALVACSETVEPPIPSQLSVWGSAIQPIRRQLVAYLRSLRSRSPPCSASLRSAQQPIRTTTQVHLAYRNSHRCSSNRSIRCRHPSTSSRGPIS